MAKRPRPVRDLDDAMTWLSYWSRFTSGEMSRNMAGILNVLVQMDLEMSELRERCTSLAQRNERLEAAREKGGEGL